MERFAIGIDLGGTAIKAALVSSSRGCVAQTSTDTEAEEGPERVLDNISALVGGLSEQAPDDVMGVGIGSPGIINMDRTTVSHPPNLPGWGEVHLGEAISTRLGSRTRVVVENDANVAGLGSAHYGAGKPFPSFIMVTLGTGVGGAIIHENRIFRGATGGAGEIGHMSVDYEGPLDNHGIPGAIEAYLGQRFLSRHARYRLRPKPESLVHGMAKKRLKNLNPKMLYDAAVQGDKDAEAVLAWAGHKLGVVLGSAVNLLDIRKIVVGGGLSAAGDYILESARATIGRFVTQGLREGIEIIQEPRGNEVGMLGAAHLVFQTFDEE